MFKECGLIEKYGSGIYRIKKLCKAHGIQEPEFSEIQKGFKVTVFKYPLKETTQETTQETTKDKIIHLLIENPNYTKQDLMRLLNKGDATIKEHLSRLKREGRLDRVGSTKSGHWKVIK